MYKVTAVATVTDRLQYSAARVCLIWPGARLSVSSGVVTQSA